MLVQDLPPARIHFLLSFSRLDNKAAPIIGASLQGGTKSFMIVGEKLDASRSSQE